MKKIQHQDGFSSIEILLVLIVVLLVGFIGYYVYHAQKEANKNLQTSSTSQESVAPNKKTAEVTKVPFDTAIHDVSITLKTDADLSKLPNYTPESFKAYMHNRLTTNRPDAQGCIRAFSISRISQVNVKGGTSDIDGPDADEDSNCENGAPALWVLTPGNGWDEISANIDICVTQNGGKVYEEFAEECVTNVSTGASARNPNGSIKQLAAS